MAELAAKQLSFRYKPQKPLIFKNLNFQIEPQTFGLLTGPSGSGKSTLFKLLAGLYPQYGGQLENGQILLDQKNCAQLPPFERAKKVALLFQNPSRQFAMKTVKEQLIFALENIQLPAAKIQARIDQVLTELQLEPFKNRRLQTLSGGEQQRVALATVLALDSKIILLDEPFANVDPIGRSLLLADLKQLQQKHGKTILIADHDLTGYDGLADRLYHLDSADSQIMQVPLTELKKIPTVWQVPVKTLNAGDFVWQKLSCQTASCLLLKSNDFELPKGQIGLLSGANGVGKSTLLKALCRLHPYLGQIKFQQQIAQKFSAKKWALIVGLVFQNSSDQFIRLTAQEEISLSQKNTLRPDYWSAERIKKAVQRLNLTKVLDQVCYQLSGGQQKKLQLLAMLIMAQPVLLLDEPFAGLDPQSLANALQLIKQTVNDLQSSLLLVSHQRAGVTDQLDYELHLANQQLTLVTGGAAND